MDKIQKIRQEIGRLKGRLKNSNYYLDNSQQAVGYSFALDDFNEFLDTLSEEPSENLEEAAESHTFFAANQPGQEWETHDVTDAFKAGAEWMKSQMMKEAVEGYVTLTLTGVRTVAATIKEGDNIGIGNNVRIIIVKEENK